MKTNRNISTLIFIIVLIFFSCSNDEKTNYDTTLPIVRIQSPTLLLNYSTDIGNSSVPYRVSLTAYGIDETELKTLKLTVTNSNGFIVLEKIQEKKSDSKHSINISEKFESTTPDTYTAIFTAIDGSNNIKSESKVFTFSN